jgi:hypothetical protein
MLGSFAVLLGMYMFIMLMGNLHLEFDDMRQTGLHVRTMIAVYQVLVVSIIIVTHTFFKLFINIVKKDSVSLSLSVCLSVCVRTHTCMCIRVCFVCVYVLCLCSRVCVSICI